MDAANLNDMTRSLSSNEVSAKLKTEQLILLSSYLSRDSAKRSASVVESISLPVLFSCLQSSDGSQVQACCTVLRRLIGSVDPSHFLEVDLLESGFKHERSEVRDLVVTAVARSLESEVSCMKVLESKLGGVIVKQIGDEVLLCSQAAVSYLSEAARKYPPCAKLLFDGSGLLAELHKLLCETSVVRYRLLAMVSELATSSPELLSQCQAAGLLSPLLDDLATDDVLVRLNAIEISSSLVAAPHTVRYLQEQRILSQLSDIIVASDSEPLSQFVLPAVFKFYGQLCSAGHVSPAELHGQYPIFLERTLLLLESQDAMLFVTLMDTVAMVCGSSSGGGSVGGRGEGTRLVLHHAGCKAAFGAVCRAMIAGPQEARCQALVTMREALFAATSATAALSAEDVALAEGLWYAQIAARGAASPAAAAWSYAKDPSVATRCAALSLVAAMLRLQRGVRDVLGLPGFLEYLVDRATETEQSGWEAKYLLVKEMLASALVKESLDTPSQLMLRTYLREGAVYSKVQAAVKVDEEHM